MPNYIYTSAGTFMQKYGDSDYRMYEFDTTTGQRSNLFGALWLAYATNPITIGLDTMYQQWYYATGSIQPGEIIDYTAETPNTGLPMSGWTNGLTIQEYAGPTEVAVSGLSVSQYWVPFTQNSFYAWDNGSYDSTQYLIHDGTSWLFTYFDDTLASLEQPFLSGPLGNYTNGVVVSTLAV